jgi:DNA-binding transcriptional regulator YhcF (GntR family)
MTATGLPEVEIDTKSSTPPYEQVRTRLAELITSGELPVGAKLPTVRGLAEQLGVAANTTARAYRELESAGLIETRGRRGTFVSARGEQTLTRLRAAADRYAALARSLAVEPETALQVVTSAIHDTSRDTLKNPPARSDH